MKKWNKIVAVTSVVAIVLGVVQGVPAEISAKAKKATLKKKKLTINVGKSKKIQIKYKKKKCTYTFKSNKKKVATVSKTGKVKAKKVGVAMITVREKQNGKNKTIGKVKVTVKEKAVQTPEQTIAPTTESAQPTATTAATTQPTVAPTVAPTVTPEPTKAPIMQTVDRTNFEMPQYYDWERDEISAYPEVQEIEYYSTTTETTRKANIILPLNYSEDKQYPVLYLLHGIGGDHKEWEGGNPESLIQNLIIDGEAQEMIVVMPNVRARANDAATGELTVEHFSAFDNFINDLRDDLMPYIAENYSIKTGRENTAIAGLSMGGRTSLYIGITMVDTFGYIGAFSPAIGVLPYTTEDGLFTEETLKLPDEYNTGNTLVMICNGTADSVVNDWPAKYSNALTTNGSDHIYYEIEDGTHSFAVWKNGLYNFAKRIF